MAALELRGVSSDACFVLWFDMAGMHFEEIGRCSLFGDGSRRTDTWRSQRRGWGPRSPAQLATAVAMARMAKGWGASAGAAGAARGSGW
jgi:hypothetical protein